MNIRTLEHVQDALDAALAWRRRELSAIRTAVKGTKGLEQALQLRAGVALLYAHWEGFIKNASDIYLEYVSRQVKTCEALAVNFVAISLGRELNEAFQSRKIAQRIRLVEMLRNESVTPARIPIRGAVSSANVNSDVLRDIAQMLGLEYKPYEMKAKLIDESLLASRNKIAHGEYLEIDGVRFDEMLTEVTNLLELFRNQISNAAAQKSYLVGATGA